VFDDLISTQDFRHDVHDAIDDMSNECSSLTHTETVQGLQTSITSGTLHISKFTKHLPAPMREYTVCTEIYNELCCERKFTQCDVLLVTVQHTHLEQPKNKTSPEREDMTSTCRTASGTSIVMHLNGHDGRLYAGKLQLSAELD
jgi:hypothetical protein